MGCAIGIDELYRHGIFGAVSSRSLRGKVRGSRGSGNFRDRSGTAKVNGADVNLRFSQRAVQQLDAIEVRGIRDTVDFFLQAVDFLLQVIAVNLVVIGAVRRLGGQLDHTVEHVLHFLHRTLTGLYQRDIVLYVLLRGFQTSDLCAHLQRSRRNHAGD